MKQLINVKLKKNELRLFALVYRNFFRNEKRLIDSRLNWSDLSRKDGEIFFLKLGSNYYLRLISIFLKCVSVGKHCTPK